VNFLRILTQQSRILNPWLKYALSGCRQNWRSEPVTRGQYIWTSRPVVITAIRLSFDCNSTARRPFDDLRYDRAAALRPEYISRSIWLRLAGYVSVTLMTFDKQSNGRRTTIESKSNLSSKHSITSCARGDTICPRPSSLPPWSPKGFAHRRADAT